MTFRSHITQVMQNYFDSTDRRTRENFASLEVQLLNMSALELEDLTSRVIRELSQSLQDTPINIDNCGVYYSGLVPENLITKIDQSTFSSVVGKMGSVTRTLLPYDDMLPVPSRVEFGASVAIPSPLLFTIIGTGDSQSQVPSVKHMAPGELPIPNRLTFWLDQIGLNLLNVTLTITGEVYPKAPWESERKKVTESLTIRGEGVAFTRNRWQSVDNISVRGLAIGVRLRGWSMPFSLPAVLDASRPYTTPQDRGTLFPRYWQISNSESLLKEVYMAGGFTGLENVNTYATSESLIDVAVEPNTNGMYAISNSTLHYVDRREILPNLKQTGLSIEPLFGLQVVPDTLKTGAVRYVTLSGIPYANYASTFQYRYVMDDQYTILPTGALGPRGTGWRRGTPEAVTLPLLENRDYTFRLEVQDNNGATTYDVVPYRNAAFVPLKSIDISSLIDSVNGLAFDSYGKLWVWNGSFAIPVTIHYDGYVLDLDSKTIFLTDPYGSLQIS